MRSLLDSTATASCPCLLAMYTMRGERRAKERVRDRRRERDRHKKTASGDVQLSLFFLDAHTVTRPIHAMA